jgi:hypothetical protein
MPDDGPSETRLTAPAEPVLAQALASTDGGAGRAERSLESDSPGGTPSRWNPGPLFSGAPPQYASEPTTSPPPTVESF